MNEGIAINSELCVEDLNLTMLLLEDAINKGIWQFEELQSAMMVHKKLLDLVNQFTDHVSKKEK